MVCQDLVISVIIYLRKLVIYLKKFIALLLSLVLLVGCTNNKNDQKTLTDEEKTLLLIQECINEYNTYGLADSTLPSRKTPPIPLGISQIPELTSLSKLKKIEDEHSNAVFIGSYPIENYQMIFHLYSYCDTFWSCAEASFEINPDTIMPDNPAFTSVKKILDDLLPKNRQVFNYLYGIDIELDKKEHPDYPGYFKVLKIGELENPTSIEQIKSQAESIFTVDFISSIYPDVFESEESIYKEIDGSLYSVENVPSLQPETYYDTSLIINSKETENEILVDIAISYDEIIDPQINRIKIQKTENGYRLAEIY